MATLIEQLNESVAFIKARVTSQSSIGIILGSGLSNLANQIVTEQEIPYGEIPHFPVSTVEGHRGKLIFGTLGGVPVWVMAGRFHFYEGYSAQQVAYPVRVMRLLGVETLLLSNAAGGVNPAFEVGDLMIIKDHISLFQVNPLLGKNEDSLGTRFPDMSEPYSKDLIRRVKGLATRHNISLHEGVYLGVTGPTFETRAEYKLIHIVGGDAVGMSTVQETIAAVHAGMKVFAMSVITDLGIREEENTITHEEVLQAATAAEPKMTLLFTGLVQELAGQ
ncbi:MAG: purine-nucleoside phosphorylase [Sediminibacterium sp.]|jgi:purine-nucleoside phosphorylase|nr:purine-nucleoside phosphorylase [Chitinophagaceae bacterium]MCA6472387.1 purine-nucleoside phosphorylase [Chitinophagaceae bacterium]MCA6489800.1 purine-nucleoside phosphorylase [Chitinophagaceae bacterium]MCA6499790.1 purine-nucleoside phosphorylase [Chitinophagaceae bacterium]MCA6516721.1 purine-nucleoside phosphorylase [Chitinophagaceae bacterium]